MAAIFYYLLIYPMSHLPLRGLYILSDIFYLVLVGPFNYRKEVIDNNLKNSFPDTPKKYRISLRKRFYRHFSDLMVEAIKNISISEKELRKRFVVKNPELMTELYQKNRSVILVSGHYNNWEWLITSQSFLFPHKPLGIGMPLTSKFWDSKMNEKRQRFGMKVVHAGNFKKVVNDHSGEPVAILTLGDQSPSDARKSFWMDFLNQQTAVLFGTEQMANEFDFSVVYFIIRKHRRGYYEMELKLICEDPKTMSWGEITESHTRLLENEIKQNPPYWIWSHKRWKREVPEDLVKLKIQQKKKFNERFNKD